MTDSILQHRHDEVAVVTLNRPRVLNAWNATMRDALIDTLNALDADVTVRGIVLTGAGDRAFGAGQDFNEARSFDPERAERWVGEWERLYATLRGLSRPVVAALNGIAAGSAFQVALLCDVRIGHIGVRMGQPEINAGIPSTTGPWIMREHLGLSRTIELTLSGRLMDAVECERLGLIHRLVDTAQVLPEAIAYAATLGRKPQVAMRLNRQRFREMTEPGFRDCLEAGIRLQREAYASGEPQALMEDFLARRKPTG